jgi:hypothetical protein
MILIPYRSGPQLTYVGDSPQFDKSRPACKPSLSGEMRGLISADEAQSPSLHRRETACVRSVSRSSVSPSVNERM